MSELIQTYSNFFRAYLELHVALAPIIAIVIRTAATVVAPLPGTPIDLLNLAFFTKTQGFIYAEISILLGNSINFWIARQFREPVVNKFIALEKIHEWEKKINDKSGFWGLVAVRMSTILVFDYMSYVAGLTQMSFRRFFAATLLASVPFAAAFYYFGGTIIKAELVWSIAIITLGTIIFSILKKRGVFKKFYR